MHGDISWPYISPTIQKNLAEALACHCRSSLQKRKLKQDEALVVLPSVTAEPTFTPTLPTPSPTVPLFEEEATDLPPPTDTPAPTPLPTPFPVDVTAYELGIQVEHSLDFNTENQDNYYRSVSHDLGLRWVKQQVRWDLVEAEPGRDRLEHTWISSCQAPSATISKCCYPLFQRRIGRESRRSTSSSTARRLIL